MANKNIKSSIAQLRDQVETIRGRVAALRTERESVDSAPLTREEALEQLDRMIRTASGPYADDFPRSWLIRPARATLLLSLMETDGRGTFSPSFFAWLLADILRERLVGEIDTAYATTPAGLPAADRQRRLAEIDAEILANERLEEQLIIEAEQVGVVIDRRGDLDPRAFLEINSDTPPLSAA